MNEEETFFDEEKPDELSHTDCLASVKDEEDEEEEESQETENSAEKRVQFSNQNSPNSLLSHQGSSSTELSACVNDIAIERTESKEEGAGRKEDSLFTEPEVVVQISNQDSPNSMLSHQGSSSTEESACVNDIAIERTESKEEGASRKEDSLFTEPEVVVIADKDEVMYEWLEASHETTHDKGSLEQETQLLSVRADSPESGATGEFFTPLTSPLVSGAATPVASEGAYSTESDFTDARDSTPVPEDYDTGERLCCSESPIKCQNYSGQSKQWQCRVAMKMFLHQILFLLSTSFL